MKNVAKCNTWCELQNPVNHRVFECKLCPKPFGRGHVCLGVTHRCPPQLRVPNTTPGQVGLPAEFKHINKRRKRNLQGFP
ncbi:hypothetical protein RGQ29_031782 [Quercus rubra]|uniref:Uncharacterized protein n=1 Tax=Quercus rubra TaxID=3512 RepID=A0AAN7EN26_QUERU|nr:hypothetical protein RGQ29_031782 [Quercus rubra]